MRNRIGFAGPAAQGFAPGGEPTGRDILDLVEVELWAVYGAAPTPSDWAGPMAAVLFGVVGAEPEEVIAALAEDLPADGHMFLRSRLGLRIVPVPEFAASVLQRGAHEMAKISACDCLIVNTSGRPLKDRTLRSRFENLTKRIQLPGVSLIVGLRAAYRRWIRLSEDEVAIRHLCDRSGREETIERCAETTPTEHLSAVVDEYHPLGRLHRPLTRHRGAVERAHPDRAFRPLSEEARRDTEAARIPGQRRWSYPGELIASVTAAWDGGRTVAEIAAHYGVSVPTVSNWIKAHRDGKDPSRLKLPLSVRSLQEALINHIRRHPHHTRTDVRRWLAEKKGVEVTKNVLKKFVVRHGLRFGAARRVVKTETQRKKLLRFISSGTTARRANAYAAEHLGLKMNRARVREFAKRHGITLDEEPRPGLSGEPMRSLVLARLAARPRATARQTAEWLYAEHGLEVDPAKLPRFADANGLRIRRVSKRKRRPPKPVRKILEANRDAVIALVRAHSDESLKAIRARLAKELKVTVTKGSLRLFCRRHGLAFAPVQISRQTDRLLLGYVAEHPGATRQAAHRWLAARMGCDVKGSLVDGFAKRHGVTWARMPTAVGGADNQKTVVDFVDAHPNATVADVMAWAKHSLTLDLQDYDIRNLLKKMGRRTAPAHTLMSARNRDMLADYLSRHPDQTLEEARDWCARAIGEVDARGLARFAKTRGHAFARSHHTPEDEPYRGELLKWMQTHPLGTAPQASAWAFERFAADFPPRTLHDFARRRGLRFVKGRPTAPGATARLRRKAAQLRPRPKRRQVRAGGQS